MIASQFEFRFRFWIIALIFSLAFACKVIDHHHAAAGLAHLLALPQQNGVQWIYAFGALLVFIGAAVRTWATAYLRSDVVHDIHLHADHLVADGPYRYVRNPLYLGIVFLSAGFGLLASRLGWFVLVFATYFFYRRLIGREEQELEQSQGESFRHFKEDVPRLFPSLTPRLPSSGRAPHWGQAFAGESFMWAFGLALATFAVTLNETVLDTIIWIALATYAIGQLIRIYRSKQSARHPAS